jgi:hypothetical protein
MILDHGLRKRPLSPSRCCDILLLNHTRICLLAAFWLPMNDPMVWPRPQRALVAERDDVAGHESSRVTSSACW